MIEPESEQVRKLGASFLLPLTMLLVSLLMFTATLPHLFLVRQALQQRKQGIWTVPPGPIPGYEEDVTNRWAAPPLNKIISFLNLPGMLGEIAISLPTTWPDSYKPGFAYPFDDLWFWRSITWPFFAVPFWCFGGRALDTLIRRKQPRLRIRIVEVVSMCVGALLLGVAVVVISLQPDDDLHKGFAWAIVPGLIWLIFGVVTLLAYAKQVRAKRAARLL